MPNPPSCPACSGGNTYPDGTGQLACPDCGHEWMPGMAVATDAAPVVRDCNGTPIANGDTVVVIKDLKVKGSSTGLKQGTLIRDIRLVEGDVEHIEGNVEKIKGLVVKTCFVRKA
ncbi:MAG: zinc ribbon domain-containing protein YjdM [Alphaproteobacteria bacterium]